MDVPRILTANWGVPDSHRLPVARQRGVYGRLPRAFGMAPAEITQVVKDSGLRGRGGAGFPTGVKWGFVPPAEKRNGKPVYLLCNADESEPGTFKDRYLMWLDPHLLIEGMIISSRALDVHRAYIYIRGEFRFIARRLEQAVNEAYDAGFLGKNILGSGFDLDLHVHVGAGAYICGEETALISSLEGEKGQPKLKPPFPAVEGAWRSPTIVNNVETLAVVPWLIEHGAAAYKAIGTPQSPGTKLLSASGHIRTPGVYEVALGYPAAEFLEKECGGLLPGRRLKAVIPGGSSVPVMTAEHLLKSNLDYESMQRNLPGGDSNKIIEAGGSYLGSGGFIVMDDTTDMVEGLTNLLRFYAHESCGQCTPCREGCGWMYQILCRVRDREASPGDLAVLRDLADNIHSKTICFFGASAAMPVQSHLIHFRGEFLERVQHNARGAGAA
ncbi:MAG: NADH-quinone oxidoreductase subunit NuoF [Deltaproteobacteria bacterium]|nr:NADH-quinone oxidoreductase subunit NuoF [Deltaproteobacteria bacterium]